MLNKNKKTLDVLSLRFFIFNDFKLLILKLFEFKSNIFW